MEGFIVKKHARLMAWFSILVLLLGLTACSDDDIGEPEVTIDPPPPNPELLLSDFVAALENQDAAHLDWVINEDFRMNLLQSTIDEWAGSGNPLLESYFDRAAFMGIHRNIFADSTGLDPNGYQVPPITSISIDVMQKLTPWALIDPGLEYFGDFEDVYSARHALLVYFHLPGNFAFEVSQELILYARMVTVGEDTGAELFGIQPLPNGVGMKTESISLGEVLSLYR